MERDCANRAFGDSIESCQRVRNFAELHDQPGNMMGEILIAFIFSELMIR